jgi:hypothetical protein
MENYKDIPELMDSEAVGGEMNPTATYPLLSDCINHILTHQNQEPIEISLEELAINGEVIADDMNTYLSRKFNSSSALKEVLKTPLHYYYYIHNTIPKVSKKHFDLGTFAHKAFLEPELFNKCAVEPKANLTLRDGVLLLLKFYYSLEGYDFDPTELAEWNQNELKALLAKKKMDCEYEIIEEEHKIIIDILKINYNNYGGGIIPLLMKGAKSEVSFYGEDAETGLNVKVRPDAINIKENIGVDAIISFKTTTANDIRKFFYDSAKYMYELSEGMYQDVVSSITGRDFKSTIMIMLQTSPPYLPAVFWWDADDLENGKYKYRFALSTVRDCFEKKLFPGFDAKAESGNFGIIEMKQPDWTTKELHPVDIED